MLLKICFLSIFAQTVICSIQQFEFDKNIFIHNILDQNAFVYKNYSQVVAFVDSSSTNIFHFLNIWNELPEFFYNIRPYLRIGLTDCAVNRYVCQSKYGINGTPIVLYYPAYTSSRFMAVSIRIGDTLADNIMFVESQINDDIRKGRLKIPADAVASLNKKAVVEPKFQIIFAYNRPQIDTEPPPPPPPSPPPPPPPPHPISTTPDSLPLKCVIQITELKEGKKETDKQGMQIQSSQEPEILIEQATIQTELPQQVRPIPANISIAHLTSANQFNVINNSNRVIIVGFYDMNCKPCKAFIEILEKLSTEFKRHKLHLGIMAVDCAVEIQLCQHYSINYYPSLRYFPERSEVTSTGIEIVPQSNYLSTESKLFNVIMEQQSFGNAKELPNIIPFIEDKLQYVSDAPGSRAILLIEEEDEPLIGPKLVFDLFGKHKVKFAAGNKDMEYALDIKEKPTLVFIFVNNELKFHLHFKGINKNITEVEDVVQDFYNNEIYDKLIE